MTTYKTFISSSFNSAGQALKNLEGFMETLVDNQLELGIDITSTEYNGCPEFYVIFNDQCLVRTQLGEGTHVFEFSLESRQINKLVLGMANKAVHDTLVEQGQVVRDKSLQINRLLVNKFDLVQDYSFFRKYFRYTCNHQEQPALPGFWHNGELELEFLAPFVLWYNQRSESNSQIADQIMHRTVDQQSLTKIENQLITLASQLRY